MPKLTMAGILHRMVMYIHAYAYPEFPPLSLLSELILLIHCQTFGKNQGYEKGQHRADHTREGKVVTVQVSGAQFMRDFRPRKIGSSRNLTKLKTPLVSKTQGLRHP